MDIKLCSMDLSSVLRHSMSTPGYQSQSRWKTQLYSFTAHSAGNKVSIRDYMQGAGYSSKEGKWCEEVLNHATITLVNETPELIFTVAGCENRKHHIERIRAGSILLPAHSQANAHPHTSSGIRHVCFQSIFLTALNNSPLHPEHPSQ